MTRIYIKRAYDHTVGDDGIRILVDRLWPRGISKDEANLDYWLKDIAPSNRLRKDFHDKENSYAEFKGKYIKELDNGEQKEALDDLKEIINNTKKNVTLVFAAKDTESNNAKVLLELIT